MRAYRVSASRSHSTLAPPTCYHLVLAASTWTRRRLLLAYGNYLPQIGINDGDKA